MPTDHDLYAAVADITSRHRGATTKLREERERLAERLAEIDRKLSEADARLAREKDAAILSHGRALLAAMEEEPGADTAPVPEAAPTPKRGPGRPRKVVVREHTRVVGEGVGS